MKHDSFATTKRGLRRDSVPMRLFEKAKRLGIWNPADIDFSKDAADWNALNERETRYLLQITTQFQAGEEAVTLDLLPLIGAIAAEGRIEEEMFLTTFLWEEAKHVDFFNRFFNEVLGAPPSDPTLMTPVYSSLFYETLPKTLHALTTDPSPEAQVRASVTYNMVVEGMLAETGYHIFYNVLDSRQILPGLREGVGKIKLDESRHIAYGVYLIARLVAGDPKLMDVFEDQMARLLPVGLDLIREGFEQFGDDIPFGLSPEDYLGYSQLQYAKRYNRVKKAIGKSIEELEAGSDDLFIEDEAVAAH
jgi:ribonucleoside-diphosphate reductase beta chain